jgi:multicomponent Na+:H+ antiporter subunit C
MELLQSIADSFNYWIYIILMMIGLYALVAKNNLVKKLIGMSIFQTAIILFYVSIGYKDGATIPILYEHQAHHGHHDAGHGDAEDAHHDVEHAVEEAAKEIHAVAEDHADGHDAHADDHDTLVDSHDAHTSSAIHAEDFANPLVHVLMLTAIVVGVATLGVGLAITQKLYGEFGSIEESEIIEQIRTGK